MQIDRIISLGGKCEVAYQARRAMKSDRAYPCDWWNVPLEGVPTLLASRFDDVFKVEHLVKMRDMPAHEGGPQLKSTFGGTRHIHEFAPGEDYMSYDMEEISRRLTAKYSFLVSRMFKDCARGGTLFIRQQIWTDPTDKAVLDVICAETIRVAASFCPKFYLVMLDYEPTLASHELLLQRSVTQHGVEVLGSDKGWDEMLASLPVSLNLNNRGKFGALDIDSSPRLPLSAMGRISTTVRALWSSRRSSRVPGPGAGASSP